MKLCVGAGSRRVVEEAAKLKVHQIVASRSQVDIGGGYIGMDQYELTEVVHRLSGSATAVVRDHGGPYQRAAAPGEKDDWTASFDCDVDAGFDGLHIDVCKLPRVEQENVLASLLERYGHSPEYYIEIGGERDDQAWLYRLVGLALSEGVTPYYAVADVGGHIHADRQQGTPRRLDDVHAVTERLHAYGVRSKAHNMDWLGDRWRYADVLDAYNVAPEYSDVEVMAWLTVMDGDSARDLLAYAHATERWTRWFNLDEGTWFERAKCALRYVLNEPVTISFLEPFMGEHESYVRERIRDALSAR